MRITASFLLIVLLLITGCVSGPVTKTDYDKFTGISSDKLEKVQEKTKQGVWIAFDFTRASKSDKNPDYFLSVYDTSVQNGFGMTNLNDFCVGKNLWLTIDGKIEKLFMGTFSANGKHIQLSGVSKNHLTLSDDLISKIKKANHIDFEISKCSTFKTNYKSVAGSISDEHLQEIKMFLSK